MSGWSGGQEQVGVTGRGERKLQSVFTPCCRYVLGRSCSAGFNPYFCLCFGWRTPARGQVPPDVVTRAKTNDRVRIQRENFRFYLEQLSVGRCGRRRLDHVISFADFNCRLANEPVSFTLSTLLSEDEQAHPLILSFSTPH